jgi:hypothetical protein
MGEKAGAGEEVIREVWVGVALRLKEEKSEMESRWGL